MRGPRGQRQHPAGRAHHLQHPSDKHTGCDKKTNKHLRIIYCDMQYHDWKLCTKLPK